MYFEKYLNMLDQQCLYLFYLCLFLCLPLMKREYYWTLRYHHCYWVVYILGCTSNVNFETVNEFWFISFLSIANEHYSLWYFLELLDKNSNLNDNCEFEACTYFCLGCENLILMLIIIQVLTQNCSRGNTKYN